MSKPNQQIIDKILKLQIRTVERGCTEAEAMEAMNKIGQLLIDYNLSMSDVKNSEARPEVEVDETIVFNDLQKEKGTMSKDAFGWYIKLAEAIAELCFCRMYYGGKAVCVWFIGMSTDVAVCKELYTWMRDQALILANFDHSRLEGVDKYVSRKRYIDSWLQGFVDKVWRRVMDEVRSRLQSEITTAIVVAKDPLINEYISKNIKVSKAKTDIKYNRQYEQAYAAGQEKGEQVTLYEAKKL